MIDATIVTTRKTLETVLDEHHVRGPAAEAILRETASLRHADRVRRAVNVAIDAAKDNVSIAAPDASVGPFAVGLCVLDAFGVGGIDGVGGDSTKRLDCFGELGSGRKRSGDGPAWTAAIHHARTAIAREIVAVDGDHNPASAVWLSPHPDGLTVLVRSRDVGSDHDCYRSADATIPIRPALAPWLLTVAREGLRRSCGLPPWHPTTGELSGVSLEEDAAPQWAALVNAIEEARERWARDAAVFAADVAAADEGHRWAEEIHKLGGTLPAEWSDPAYFADFDRQLAGLAANHPAVTVAWFREHVVSVAKEALVELVASGTVGP